MNKFGETVSSQSKTCAVVDAGLVPYAAAFELQQRAVIARKRGEIPDILILCEHPHVITLGRNGKIHNLRANDRVLSQMNVEFHESDRGGDITYHGPGQIVGYPILDLAEHRRDVRWYVHSLEEAMIRTSADLGVAARRIEGWHGIWAASASGEEEKLAAVGVHLSRWVTSHGFAYNVSTDLRYFDLIVPCGIIGKRATSLERLLNRGVQLEEVKRRLCSHAGEVFDREVISMTLSELEERLAVFASSENGTVAAETEIASAGVLRGN